MKAKAKLHYAEGELIAWIDLMEEAKSIGLRPEDVRKFIEEATK
jgi:hypothetical protein